MNADICWITEHLLKRAIPATTEVMDHGMIVLPVRRNLLDDGFVFTARLTSGTRRRHTGSPPQPELHPLERRIRWQAATGVQTSIVKFCELQPVPVRVLQPVRGRSFLDEDAQEEIARILAVLIWDDRAAPELLGRPRRKAPLVIPAVAKLSTGDIVMLDGTAGIVVSGRWLHETHYFGILALVPLVAATVPHGRLRVEVDGLVAAPELLKVCHAYAGIHTLVSTGRTLVPSDRERLLTQLRELFEFGESIVPSVASEPIGELGTIEAHRCLFATRAVAWRPMARTYLPPPLDRPIAAAAQGLVFPPILLDSVQAAGVEGDVLLEIWDREGEISLRLVTEGGRLPVIDMLSVMSDTLSVNIACGPIVPQNWIVDQAIGPISALLGVPVAVEIHAPGVVLRHTFQIGAAPAEEVSPA